jgi:hypothetical protein
MHRELLETDRDRFLPPLARALTNLSACLSRAGRRPAALGAAGQAVAIYRELVELNPKAYRADLAAADHNWRVCRQAVGEPAPDRTALTLPAQITPPQVAPVQIAPVQIAPVLHEPTADDSLPETATEAKPRTEAGVPAPAETD